METAESGEKVEDQPSLYCIAIFSILYSLITLCVLIRSTVVCRWVINQNQLFEK